METMTKKRFVYKRDSNRHHQLMDRESNPYRHVSLKHEDEKPPKRPVQPKDKSGLTDRMGASVSRLGDHYDGLHKQQHRLRQEALAGIQEQTIADNDPEFLAWCVKNGIKV